MLRLNNISAVSTLTLFLSFPCLSDWQEEDIGFTFGEQDQLVIGDGRDDKKIRVYSGDGLWSDCAGNIYEFNFTNDGWVKTAINTDDGLCHITGLDIGDGYNDGINRVYASGYNLAEYEFVSYSWLGGEVGPDIQWTNDLVLGNARNDGITRMYVAEWDEILELSYVQGWNLINIDTSGQRVDRLVVTDGRNDGVLRLYAAIGGHIYEYTWSGGEWEPDDCGAPGATSFYDMAAGQGRNDGIVGIYLAAGNDGIFELRYSGNGWEYIELTDPSLINARGVVLGDGRNDGKNRVYASSSQYLEEGYIAEFTYEGGWSQTSDIDSNAPVNGIAIGPGRNDATNRIYISGADSRIYEYSYENISSCSVEAKNWIYKAYIGYYARCPEFGGFNYWCTRLDEEGSGSDLNSIIAAFGTSQEYTDRLSDLSDSDLINNLYLNMFDRNAEFEGLAFYLNLLEAHRQDWRDSHGGIEEGATEYALSLIALDVLNGAQGNDLDVLQAKMDACSQF